VSEPDWVGYVSDDIESELTRSQEDSLGETERQRIVYLNFEPVLKVGDSQKESEGHHNRSFFIARAEGPLLIHPFEGTAGGE